MKTRLLYLTVICLFLTAFAACKKSSSTPAKSNTEYLTQASWKFQAAGIDADKNGTIDIQDNSWKDCQKDNTYTFKTGGTGVMSEGPLLCKVGDPQTVPFSWSLSGQSLTIQGSILAGNVVISTLDNNSLIVYKDTTVSNLAVRYVVSLSN